MRTAGFALALATLLASTASGGELRVATAVSLREPLEAISRAFEAEHAGTRVQLVFGASSTLAAQARAGAPLDVLLAADEESLVALAADGLVKRESEVVIAGNRLVVMAAADLAVPLAGAAELARPEVRRIAIPERAVPLGHYGREWLTRRGLLASLAPRFVITEHARATLAAVDAGHADVGIVYATDARSARSARVAFIPPAAEQPRIVYAAAPITNTPAPALAARFVAFLTGADAQRILRTAGFAPPPDEASQ